MTGMETPARLLSRNEQQTLDLGRALGRCLQPGHVVGLVGELGAGKTCFARGVALGLEVDPRTHVSSPTFTLVNEYQGRLVLYHMDLYRLGDPDELQEIGAEENYGGDGACLVEWFDRFPSAAPAGHLELRLLVTGDEERTLEVCPRGESHRRLAACWLEKVKKNTPLTGCSGD